MATQPTTYTHLPRQTRSAGMAELVLPFARLAAQYLGRFIARACKYLAVGSVPEDLPRELAAAGLTDESLAITEQLADSRPPMCRWDRRGAGLAKLAILAEDLAAEGGPWREQLTDLKEAPTQAVDEIRSRAGLLVAELLRRHGPAAARQALTEIARRLEVARQAVQRDLDQYTLRCWRPSRSDEMRQLATQLRHFAQPRRRLVRLLQRFWRNMPYAWALDESQRARVARDVATLNGAWTDRHHLMLLTVRRDALELLLGRAGLAGQLAPLFDVVRQRQGRLELLAKTFLVSASSQVARPATQLCLAETIDTVIDPHSRRTLAHLYDERVQPAGRTPERWAEYLRTNGLVIADRVCLPHQWPDLDAMLLARHLRDAAKAHLGYGDPTTAVDPQAAQTPFQRLAAVTLLDPELSGLLNQILPALAHRVVPRATFRPIAERPPAISTFLFCHSTQRRAWQALFLENFALADNDNADAYRIRDPHRILVCQFALGIPGGALTGLSAWMAAANEAYRRNLCQPVYHRANYPEQRVLSRRVKDHDDCRQMFVAAQKAHLIQLVGNPPVGYAPVIPDPRLEHLFTTRVFQPAWHEAAYFHGLVKAQKEFFVFLLSVFPHLTSLPQIQARLSREHDAEEVVLELTALGVLERSPAGQYRIASVPSQASAIIPGGLYTIQVAALNGLPEADFVAAMQADDQFYNVLFFAVRDALQTGRLSQNDVPVSVRDFRDEQFTND